MTDEQREKEREAFEAHYFVLISEKDENGCYGPWADARWGAWLARAESALLAEAVAEAASVCSDPNCLGGGADDMTFDRALTAWRKARR
jgi:hypothetical protein